MQPAFLLVVFDVEKEPVPSNARHKYIDKSLWRSIQEQEEVIDRIELNDEWYQIISRRSYRIANLTGATMVLQLDVKKLE